MVRRKRMTFGWLAACVFAGLGCVLFATPALADSIQPIAVGGTLGVGHSATITKIVTVSAGAPTAAQGDVFFLSDTTGSMGPTIAAVRTNASDILAGLSVYGNIQTGAGEYKDFPTNPWGNSSDYPYRLNAAIDGTFSTQTGIDAWSAVGGYDTPESGLYALQQSVVDPGTGWRAGSEKFILWFGDAPGHEPSDTPGYPGPSTVDTIAALQAAGATVLAFDMGGLNSSGQAAAITTATGGTLYAGFGTDVVADIIAAIGSAFDRYSVVDLEVPLIPGLGISVVPLSFNGAFDRSLERTFMFDVTFTGITPGTYDFNIFGRVDGGRVATEWDSITVVGRPPVPEPASLLLLGTGLAGLGRAWRKRRG